MVKIGGGVIDVRSRGEQFLTVLNFDTRLVISVSSFSFIEK